MKTIKFEELISPIARAILERGDRKEREIEAKEKAKGTYPKKEGR